MKILFDFNLLAHPIADAHLIEVLVACKNYVHKKLVPHEEEMDKENGYVIIASLPQNEGIVLQYFCQTESSNSNIKKAVANIDVTDAIRKLGEGANLN